MGLIFKKAISFDIQTKIATFLVEDWASSNEFQKELVLQFSLTAANKYHCSAWTEIEDQLLSYEGKVYNSVYDTIKEALNLYYDSLPENVETQRLYEEREVEREKEKNQTVSEFLFTLRQGSEPLLDTFLRNEDVCLEKFFHKTTQEVVVKGAGKGDVASVNFIVFRFICGETFKKVKDTKISYSNKGRDYGDKLDSVWDN